MELDAVLRDDNRVVYICEGGGVVHLTTTCMRLKKKKYKQWTLLMVKSKVDNPKICSYCKKKISRRVRRR